MQLALLDLNLEPWGDYALGENQPSKLKVTSLWYFECCSSYGP